MVTKNEGARQKQLRQPEAKAEVIVVQGAAVGGSKATEEERRISTLFHDLSAFLGASLETVRALAFEDGKAMRAAVAQSKKRLSDPSLRAPMIICLGPPRANFKKVPGSWLVQVLFTVPQKPAQLLACRTDADSILVFEEDTYQSALEQFPHQHITLLAAGELAGHLLQQARALGYAPAPANPLRKVRAKGSRLLDVYMTTSRRPQFFQQTLHQLLAACEATHHRTRLNVFVDQLEPETLDVVQPHLDKVSLLTTSSQLGLPFLFNTLLSHQEKVEQRSEQRADYICYIQDDCFITNPAIYFEFLVRAYEEVLPADQVGYVSGYYCPIHPGFEALPFLGKQVVLSDSFDGKNFLSPPALLRRVGPLSWHFRDGLRRGNPGPTRGSHFDLWQWKESPQCLTKQQRVSLVVPDLCVHLAQEKSESTWGNETTRRFQQERMDEGRVYNTRGTIPQFAANDFSGTTLADLD